MLPGKSRKGGTKIRGKVTERGGRKSFGGNKGAVRSLPPGPLGECTPLGNGHHLYQPHIHDTINRYG
jgi:hypothetical protein